jgi:hypothetical protein
LEKTPVVILRHAEFEEGVRVPLGIGLAALAMELILAATVAVRVP